MAPIKVLCVSDSSTMAGAPRVLLDLVRHFDRSHLAPTVLLGGRGPASQAFSQVAPTFSFQRSINVPKTTRLQGLIRPGLKKLWFRYVIERISPDVIYHNSIGGEDLLRWTARLGIPRIMHVHGIYAEHMVRKSSYHDLIATYADHYIGCSQAVSDRLHACLGVKREKISTIYAGVDVKEIIQYVSRSAGIRRSTLGLDDDTLLIGGAGYLQFNKGVDLLVEAAAIVRACYANRKIKFIWIGGHDLSRNRYARSVIQYAGELGLDDVFIFPGHQTPAYDYLGLLDIFVMCSRQESFGLVVLEAMCLQKPVAAFPVGVVPEALADGACIVTTNSSPEALADALGILIEDRGLRQCLAHTGFQEVQHRFDASKNVVLFEDVIAKVASNPHS